ncbi:MAG: hypothetical protein AAF349_24320 [Cyanobacteria bacterium P01_A01_bin.68]
MLFIASGSVLIAIPSLAQSPIELSQEKVSVVIANLSVNLSKTSNTKSESNTTINSKLVNSLNSKSVAQAQPAVDKPNRQQPVFSRIFPVMTMQQ